METVNTVSCEYSSATLTNFGDHPHRQATIRSPFPRAGWYMVLAKSSFVPGQNQPCCGLLPKGVDQPLLVTRQALPQAPSLSWYQAVVGQLAVKTELPARGAAHAAYTTAPTAER